MLCCMVTSPEEAHQSNIEGSMKSYKVSQRFQEPSVRRATPKATDTNVSVQETYDRHGRVLQTFRCVRQGYTFKKLPTVNESMSKAQ